jgi:hypothetical protein
MNRRTRAVGRTVLATLALAAVAAGCTAGDVPGAGSQATQSPPAAASSSSLPPSPSEPPGPPLLLPNMRSLGAGDLQIQVLPNRRLLRFSASLANSGPGPLLLRPTKGSMCPPRQHPADQLLHRDRNDDDSYQRRSDRVAERRHAGCMLEHPDHDHWHFDAMARYSLRLPGATEPLAARRKVSFCLRDNRRIPGQSVVVRREHFGDCGREKRQGISPGWIDIYTADLSGQSLRLPGDLGGQLLCLDLEADPRDRLVEIDETDNATSVALRIVGSDVRRMPPAPCRQPVVPSS